WALQGERPCCARNRLQSSRRRPREVGTVPWPRVVTRLRRLLHPSQGGTQGRNQALTKRETVRGNLITVPVAHAASSATEPTRQTSFWNLKTHRRLPTRPEILTMMLNALRSRIRGIHGQQLLFIILDRRRDYHKIQNPEPITDSLPTEQP